jgi:hypothetical protein
MMPVGRKRLTGVREKRLTKNPPTNEPTIPSRVVRARPIDCRPGMMARAMRPARKPTTMNQMSCMTTPLGM